MYFYAKINVSILCPIVRDLGLKSLLSPDANAGGTMLQNIFASSNVDKYVRKSFRSHGTMTPGCAIEPQYTLRGLGSKFAFRKVWSS